MDSHFNELFHEFSENSPKGNFHKVICLNEFLDMTWENISKLVPTLPRAWYELSQLPLEDRMEFLHEFWANKMKYHPGFSDVLKNFFSRLDDIGIYATQKLFDDPFHPQIVYSIANNSGFFRGCPPANEINLIDLQNSFPGVIFPQDYLAFLEVHNGFHKTTDCTGIIDSNNMYNAYQKFQELVQNHGEIYTKNNQPVDPKKLIPFYQSFGMPYFQCFWSEWYPENEMGVVYYSDSSHKVSDVNDGGTTIEHLCFSTFTDWLMFYIEPVDT